MVQASLSIQLCSCYQSSSIDVHVWDGMVRVSHYYRKNATTYSACNEGQNFCGVFSETASFQSYGTSCFVRLPCSRPFFLSPEYARALLKCMLTGLAAVFMPLAYVMRRFICDCQLSLRFSSSFRGRSVLVNSMSSSLQGVTVVPLYSFRLNWSVQTRCLGSLYARPQAHEAARAPHFFS